jgi:hypothetical protein
MRVREPGSRSRPGDQTGRLDVVWQLRRTPFIRAGLRFVATACIAMLAVVAFFTLFFVWAFGHPLAWSVLGALFALVPLAGLILASAVAVRAAVATGPGRIAIRFLGAWRVVDLGQVRVVRLSDRGPFGGFGGFPGFSGRAERPAIGGPRPGGPGGWGPGGPVDGGQGPRSLVLEDVEGRRVEIGVDALDAGLAAAVRDGLASDAEVDPDAARALGQTDQERGPRP